MKPSPILTEMPWNIKERIAEFLDPDSQMNLRQSCKSLKTAVDKAPVHHRALNISLTSQEISVHFFTMNHQRKLSFVYQRKGYILENSLQFYSKTVRNGDPIDGAVARFLKVFRNSKVSIDTLELNFSLSKRKGDVVKKQKYMRAFCEAIERIGQQLSVRNFKISVDNNETDILSILSHLKPGTLRTIILENGYGNENLKVSLEEIAQLEQWKLAKVLFCRRFQLSLPYPTWAHFRFIIVRIPTLTLDTLKSIIERFEHNADWRRARIKTQQSIKKEVTKYLRPFQSINARRILRPSDIPNPYRYVPQIRANVFQHYVDLMKTDED